LLFRLKIKKNIAEQLTAYSRRTAFEVQRIGTGIDLTGRRKDGSEFPVEVMLSPLGNAEGILVTAAIRDISVRKNTEERLAKTVEAEINRRFTRLFAGWNERQSASGDFHGQ
jgi:hypothetical protein